MSESTDEADLPVLTSLRPGQRSQVWLGGPGDDHPVLLFETNSILIEAPNWSLDGRRLLVNGEGLLWGLGLDSPGAGLRQVEIDGVPPLNNDHVLDPDGEHIFVSAMDGHIYRAPLAGGPGVRVSPDDGRWHFLHGVSPDGRRLAYVEIAGLGSPGRLATVSAAGGDPIYVDAGRGHADGPEWSPDGEWLYFNTEAFTSRPGHAQLARSSLSDGILERVRESTRVDWFPHLSPNGRLGSYLSFPAGTIGHPGNLEVLVTVVSTDDWAASLQSYVVFGGQGTLNVNSWAPDSARFAFVAYPVS